MKLYKILVNGKSCHGGNMKWSLPKKDNMTQKQEVILQLNLTAQVSRNWALQKRITRLASIINQLKKAGWDFTTEERSGDYVYKVSYTREQVLLDLSTLNYKLI